MGGRVYDKLQVLEMSEENGFSWTVKAELPAARFDASSTVAGGRLWLMGGYSEDEEPFRDVIIYDTATDTWAAGPALPWPDVDSPKATHAAELNGELHWYHDRTYRYVPAVLHRDGAWVEEPWGGLPVEGICQVAQILLG